MKYHLSTLEYILRKKNTFPSASNHRLLLFALTAGLAHPATFVHFEIKRIRIYISP
jgi:hypothetical protein